MQSKESPDETYVERVSELLGVRLVVRRFGQIGMSRWGFQWGARGFVLTQAPNDEYGRLVVARHHGPNVILPLKLRRAGMDFRVGIRKSGECSARRTLGRKQSMYNDTAVDDIQAKENGDNLRQGWGWVEPRPDYSIGPALDETTNIKCTKSRML